MAETSGLVQRVKILPSISAAFIYIGPTSASAQVFYVLRRRDDDDAYGAFLANMVDAFSAAMVALRPVVAIHDTGSAEITAMRIDPV